MYVNIWWRDPGSNWGHTDFQSVALPTELLRLEGREVYGLGPRSGRSTLAAHPDHDVDAVDLGARRQRRQLVERQVVRADVDHLAGLDVLEVVVRRHRRVVDATIGVEVDLASEAVVDEQLERVVDGRLRHAAR